MNVKIKKLHEDAIVPTYGSAGAACFDLYAHDVEPEPDGKSTYVFTGVAVKIPDDHVMLIFSRSGHGFNWSTRLCNCVGVLDSDYTGEVMVKLRHDGIDAPCLLPNDRIAQAMILPIQQVTFEVVDELPKTERGTNGFGSTGR